jgi:pectate lyase
MVSLPYANADVTLRSLAAQAEGFGRFATGGLHGSLYHVTSLLGKLNFSLTYLFINP